MEMRRLLHHVAAMTHSPCSLRCPEDVVLAAPLMLGYWPGPAVCAVVVDRADHVVLVMRWERDVQTMLPLIAGALPGVPAATTCHLVAYSEAEPHQDLQASAVAHAIEQVAGVGIQRGRVLVAGRAGSSVLWAPFEPDMPGDRACEISEDVVATTARMWGLRPWVRSRADYVGDIAPREEEGARVVEALRSTSPISAVQRDEVLRRLPRHLRAGSMAPAVIAECLVALADVRVRDTLLWDLMQEDPQAWHTAASSLAQVVACSTEEYVAAPATILAILRWQMGDGTRAVAAIERALAADPAYTLAGLVDRCLTTGMHPAVWRDGLVTLTREECLRSA